MMDSSNKILWTETGGCCIYCGHRLTLEELTVDHIIPKSRGGINEMINKVACCQECNNRKGNSYPNEFIGTMSPRQRRGYHNRLTSLFQQNKLSSDKMDLLAGSSPVSKTNCRSFVFRLFNKEIKLLAVIRTK